MTSWNSRSHLSAAGRFLLIGGIAMILLLGFNAAKLSVQGPTSVYAAATPTRDRTFTVNTNLLQGSGYTGRELTNWLDRVHPGSRLAPYGDSFAAAEAKTGVTAQGLLALAIVQTGWGAQIGGNDVYALNGHSYSSIGTGIVDGAVWIKQNYLIPGGTYYAGATLAGMGKNYATSGSWPRLVASVAQQMYSPLSPATTQTTPPVTTQTTPPVTTQTTPPVTQTTPPTTHSAPPTTQSPPPTTQSAPPTTQSTPPTTKTSPPPANPAPAANNPSPDPNAGGSGNSGSGSANSGSGSGNSGSGSANSGSGSANSGAGSDNGGSGSASSGSGSDNGSAGSANSGSGSDNGGAWAGGDPGSGTGAGAPPTTVPSPAPQQDCVPLLLPSLAPALQPCEKAGNSHPHGASGKPSPTSKNTSTPATGAAAQSGSAQSSSHGASASGSSNNGSASAGSGNHGNTGSATSGGGDTGSGSGNTGATGSGGAVGTAAGGVAPTPQSNSPQAAAAKEVSLVASQGDGLAWPAVLGGLALFLGLALLLLARRSPGGARPRGR